MCSSRHLFRGCVVHIVSLQLVSVGADIRRNHFHLAQNEIIHHSEHEEETSFHPDVISAVNHPETCRERQEVVITHLVRTFILKSRVENYSRQVRCVDFMLVSVGRDHTQLGFWAVLMSRLQTGRSCSGGSVGSDGPDATCCWREVFGNVGPSHQPRLC